MKKVLLLVCTAALILSGCAAKEQTGSDPVEAVEAEKTGEAEETKEPEIVKRVNIYHPDEELLEMENTSVEITGFTAEALWEKLADYNAFPDDIQILSMTEGTEHDTRVICLDLSEGFRSYVCSLGTSGEYFVIQSIVDTFVEAFEAGGLRLTIDGMILETGHNIYDSILKPTWL